MVQRQKTKTDKMGHARNFREFPVWQDSVDFCTTIYKACESLPWFEKRGLSDQLQRATVSISSNIAEGSGRSSDTEFCHFLDIALGSAYEVETQLLIANNISYLTDESYKILHERIVSIERQLYALIRTLRQNKE